MNDEAADVLAEADELISALESHPDPEVGEKLGALLERIDVVHRSALTHLVLTIQGMAGDAFLNRLTADPAIRLLLMSYDLLAVDRRLLAEEALDAVRGHLHSHGVDVELLEVVGGTVYVRLHGRAGSAEMDAGAVRRDLEAALQAGLLGFQQLEIGERGRVAPKAALVPLGGLRRARRPVYVAALTTGELQPGAVRAVQIGDESVLIANVDGDFHAVHNRCGESPLPLEFSSLSGIELVCSWHGCRYDVRTGARVDAPHGVDADRLVVFPVRVEGGVVQIAVGTEPAPAMEA